MGFVWDINIYKWDLYGIINGIHIYIYIYIYMGFCSWIIGCRLHVYQQLMSTDGVADDFC